MQNGFLIVLGSAIVGVGIALSGSTTELVKHHMSQQLQSACWDTNVTNGLNGLTVEEATSNFENSYPSGMPQSDQDQVTKSLQVTLSNFAFTNSQNEGGTINCDASMTFTYTRPDKSVYSNTDGNIVSYEVHPAQGGYSSEMSSSDIPSGVIVYTDDSPNSSDSSSN